jgi:PAS domain S-box-containing protein
MFLLALAGIELTREGGRLASVWLANAAIIALLLRTERTLWGAIFAASLAGNIVASLLAGDSFWVAIALSACNLAEIGLVACLFARRYPVPATLDTPARLSALAVLAVIAALVSTALAGLSLAALGSAVDSEPLAHWLVADLLGILILTPLLVSLAQPRTARMRGSLVEYVILLLAAATITGQVFSHDQPFIFLIAPMLMLAGLRLPLERCASLVLVVSAIAVGLTFEGMGPLNLPPIPDGARLFLIQGFVATAVALTLPVSALRHERAQTAAALLSGEEHYRLLADHGSDLILRLTASGEADYVSSAAERLLGWSADTLCGGALLHHIDPTDRSRFTAALHRARDHGNSVTCFRMRHANGDDRWIEAHMRLAGPMATASANAAAEGREPSELPVIATLRDIHDRRTAEMLATERAARLSSSNRLLVMAEELASLGHWVIDPTGRTVTLSAGAAAMLGLSGLAVDLGEALALLPHVDRLRLLRTFAAARRAEAPAECVVRLDDDTGTRTLQLRMQIYGVGAAASLFGVISDITAKLEAEGRLVTALDEARAAASFRSQFLATMSHEIRTPMTGVIGMVELLESDPGEDERRLYLRTLRESGEVLMAVLDDILDFSKVDAGRVTIAADPFDLGATLLTTLRLFERSAARRGLRLRLDAPPPDSVWVRGDPVRLRQVLGNLLSNAIKFSDRGEVTLRCTAQRAPRGCQRLRLSVIDQGVGITPELRRRLFEPFVQEANATRGGGTGLGLAISRRLVTAMGGNILVQSKLHQGTTFTVTLTLPDAVPTEAPAAVSDPTADQPLDILLAEDNPVNQLLITALCRRFGHRITCAADGELAVEAAAAKPFDLILMDMQMPRCDGLSATRRIRSETGLSAKTPIIALTADAAADWALYEDAGLDGLLTKPIDSTAFAATLDQIGRQRFSPPRQIAQPPATVAARAPLDPATIAELQAMLGPVRLNQLLILLGTELDQRPQAIRAAIADRDFAAATAEAHSLKGAAANLGASRVSDAARDIEACLGAAPRSGSRRLAAALRQLAGEVEAAQQALTALRHQTITQLIHA